MSKEKTITVAGVTFSADQVKTAVVKIDDREVAIYERKPEPRPGFAAGAKQEAEPDK